MRRHKYNHLLMLAPQNNPPVIDVGKNAVTKTIDIAEKGPGGDKDAPALDVVKTTTSQTIDDGQEIAEDDTDALVG